MKSIGRKIFFDILTGNPIKDTGERRGTTVSETTIEQDISTFTVLTERIRETFDVIELSFGEYAQDFAACNGYKVNPKTKKLEFSFPEEGEQPQEPIYIKPLSKSVEELELENVKLKKRLETSESAIMMLMDLQMM